MSLQMVGALPPPPKAVGGEQDLLSFYQEYGDHTTCAWGYCTVTWDGRNEKGDEVSSGIYFYRITAGGTSRESRGDFSAIKRMVLMK